MSEEINPFQSPQDTPDSSSSRAAARFRAGHTRAIVALACLALCGLGHLASAGSAILDLRLLQRIAANEFVSQEEVDQCDLRSEALQLATFATFWLSGIAFIVWFHRANSNLRVLGLARVEYSAGWTIGGWFIPIGNLFIPYNIMAEIWNGSAPENAASRYAKAAPGLVWVRCWWAGWLLMNLASSITTKVWAVSNDLQAAIEARWGSLVSNLIAVLAAALAIQVVRRVDANQAERRRLREAAEILNPEAQGSALLFGANASSGYPFPIPEPAPPATAEPTDSFPMPWLEKR